MTGATMTASAIEQAKALTIDDAYAALPDRATQHPAIWQRILTASPTLAVAIYKNHFWVNDPIDPIRKVRSLSTDKLLPLMLCVYLHRGGTEPEQEAAFWQRVWHRVGN